MGLEFYARKFLPQVYRLSPRLVLSKAYSSPAFIPEAWASAELPVTKAFTPPSSWYTSPCMSRWEEKSVFGNTWQLVGHVGQVSQPGQYFTGQLSRSPYVVCRDEGGQLRAFHNVCRHHAAAVASGAGCAHKFTCPYHGWTYGLDGRLLQAKRLKGIENFKASQNGLHSIYVDTWGPFIFLHLGLGQDKESASNAEEGVAGWLQEGGGVALSCGLGDDLVHVATRRWEVKCNWKVFCDNYLDGGYHVPIAHPELSSFINMSTYSSTLYERLSIQSCEPGTGERLAGSRDVAYIFMYPNFMINRYGPWMDTNVVRPLTHNSCEVLFEYYIEPSLAADSKFIEDSLQGSRVVQDEDIALCEAVQRGLESPAYDVGRYAPAVEHPMFHFHQLLHADIMPHVPSG